MDDILASVLGGISQNLYNQQAAAGPPLIDHPPDILLLQETCAWPRTGERFHPFVNTIFAADHLPRGFVGLPPAANVGKASAETDALPCLLPSSATDITSETLPAIPTPRSSSNFSAAVQLQSPSSPESSHDEVCVLDGQQGEDRDAA